MKTLLLSWIFALVSSSAILDFCFNKIIIERFPVYSSSGSASCATELNWSVEGCPVYSIGGEIQGSHSVALLLKQSDNFLPTPCPKPKSMSQDKVLLSSFSFLNNLTRKNTQITSSWTPSLLSCKSESQNQSKTTQNWTEEAAQVLGFHYLTHFVQINRTKQRL